MIIRAIIEWDKEVQAYSATCPELNFVSSFSDNKEQAMPTASFAIDNLQDAIKLMLKIKIV